MNGNQYVNRTVLVLQAERHLCRSRVSGSHGAIQTRNAKSIVDVIERAKSGLHPVL